jgi:hypothetical protein
VTAVTCFDGADWGIGSDVNVYYSDPELPEETFIVSGWLLGITPDAREGVYVVLREETPSYAETWDEEPYQTRAIPCEWVVEIENQEIGDDE